MNKKITIPLTAVAALVAVAAPVHSARAQEKTLTKPLNQLAIQGMQASFLKDGKKGNGGGDRKTSFVASRITSESPVSAAVIAIHESL